MCKEDINHKDYNYSGYNINFFLTHGEKQIEVKTEFTPSILEQGNDDLLLWPSNWQFMWSKQFAWTALNANSNSWYTKD